MEGDMRREGLEYGLIKSNIAANLKRQAPIRKEPIDHTYGSRSVYLVSILCNVEKFDDCWLGPPALDLCWRILKLVHELTGSLLQVGRDLLRLRV